MNLESQHISMHDTCLLNPSPGRHPINENAEMVVRTYAGMEMKEESLLLPPPWLRGPVWLRQRKEG